MTAIRRLRILALAACAAAALSGCETKAPGANFPALTYGHLAPIRLDVARIEISSTYTPPTVKPNVDHLFPVTPLTAAKGWAGDRLKAVGAAGLARVTIRNAGVVEVPLKRTKGLKGMLTTEPSERYDGVIEIEIRILDGGGRERGSVSSRAERSRSVSENISLRGREKVWFEMTEAMMNDLNTAIETQIRRRLSVFVR